MSHMDILKSLIGASTAVLEGGFIYFDSTGF
jgi:hypothetical protein